MARFNSNELLDSTFGTNGKTITEVNGYAAANSSVLQKDGKILLGGSTFIGDFTGKNYFVLARYNNDVNKKQIIIKKIKHYAATHNNAQSALLNKVNIYPNPAKSTLHVDGLSISNKTTLTIIDFMGNIKLQAFANNNSCNLNIASLPAGNYC